MTGKIISSFPSFTPFIPLSPALLSFLLFSHPLYLVFLASFNSHFLPPSPLIFNSSILLYIFLLSPSLFPHSFYLSSLVTFLSLWYSNSVLGFPQMWRELALIYNDINLLIKFVNYNDVNLLIKPANFSPKVFCSFILVPNFEVAPRFTGNLCRPVYVNLLPYKLPTLNY